MSLDIHKEKVIILDFGSQYTQLIARRVREERVYCEIHPYNINIEELKVISPKAIILSGGPSSIYDDGAPNIEKEIFELGIPILGICYGMHIIVHLLEGEVAPSINREYGRAVIRILSFEGLFSGFEGDNKIEVWMSHGDSIKELPPGFSVTGISENELTAAIEDKERKIFGVQFHPEVIHTPRGLEILRNFLFDVAGLKGLWNMRSFIENEVEEIRERVGDSRVICALSGGVDSSVVAALLYNAIGKNLTCIFINNGVLRKGEEDRVKKVFQGTFDMDLHYIDAADEFLSRLSGVVDPERKRKIIGNLFIELFEAEADKISGVKYLAQGTLYPDVIESISFKGPSATIKSHHNVGGLPEEMNLELIEPLRELFKDEVRVLGRELGLTDEIIKRHPFPGPGLAVRILGEVTKENVKMLQEADVVVENEIRASGLYNEIWQSFAVLLPVKTVGVMGDERTYDNVIALRAVQSLDGMTADWVRLPFELLARISNRIINEVKGVNRVVYDISSKPPSTIEWE